MVNGPNFASLVRLALIGFVLLVVGIVVWDIYNAVHSTLMEFFPGVAQSEAQRQIAENAARTAEIKRQAAFDAEWGPRVETVKGVAALLLWLLAGLVPSLALLAGFLWIMKQIRKPDVSGLPPSFHWTDEAKREAMAMHQQRLTAVAEKLPVPETWSPTYSPTYDAPAPIVKEIPQPSLKDLLALAEFCLGIDENSNPVIVGGEKKSMGYGGKSGSGKTNTAVFHALQIVNSGGELVVGDPHLGNDRSFQNYMGSFGSAINIVGPDHTEILDLTRGFHNDWKQRKRRGQDEWPLRVLVLDEWTELLKADNAELFMTMIADIIRGGAKFSMVVWLLSQNWAAASTGGNTVRNILNWTVAHQMRKNEVGMMTGMAGAAVPTDVGELLPGNAYVFGLPEGTKRIRVPQINIEELAALPAPNIKQLPRDDKTAIKDIARILREDGGDAC